MFEQKESPRLAYAQRTPLFPFRRSAEQIIGQVLLALFIWNYFPKQEATGRIVVIVASFLIAYLVVPFVQFGWRWLSAPYFLEKEKNERLENELARAKTKSLIDPDHPFVTIVFPVSDLLSSEVRKEYIFVKNVGGRPALDVQVQDLSAQWNGATYLAQFPAI